MPRCLCSACGSSRGWAPSASMAHPLLQRPHGPRHAQGPGGEGCCAWWRAAWPCISQHATGCVPPLSCGPAFSSCPACHPALLHCRAPHAQALVKAGLLQTMPQLLAYEYWHPITPVAVQVGCVPSSLCSCEGRMQQGVGCLPRREQSGKFMMV